VAWQKRLYFFTKGDFMRYYKIITSFALSFCLFFNIYAAKKTYGDVRVSQVVSVYDGDTFKVDIDDFPPIVGEKVSIRIAGIGTPEIRSKNSKVKEKALLARFYTEIALSAAKEIVLRNMRRDECFGILADVELDGKDLARDLIRNGLAVKYNGGKRPRWG
jgi:endonuclease YncB( thermonuclease family)